MTRSLRHLPTPCSSAGFSLIELAIVLVIFTLLAGGLMMTLSAQQETRRLTEVRRQLADIREALIGYALANGRLPPAADPTLASGTVGAGVATEDLEKGVLPWATLGLPETDPWGQRFTYRVVPEFADKIDENTVPKCDPPASTPPPPVQASFALCSQGNITVADGTANIATELPVIVISHGRNGLGGYGRDGKRRSGAAGNELENADDNTNFVSRPQSPDFDDEVTWVPLPILMSRMVTTGRLP
ncbi:MAG: type II secretion system GspH family protein [Azonexus sp.]|jgi:prepilin-type N-terminal cleavage/methylation domain-containing protein|nr:type II secretion system GspH family protein [Azonexus sp.]